MVNFKCEFCNRIFNRISDKHQHERWCINNPNREIRKGNSSSLKWIESMKHRKNSNQFIKNKELGTPLLKGNNPNKNGNGFKHHSEESKNKIREARKRILREKPSNNNLRRKSYEFNGDILDSRYEVIVAKELFKNEIKYEVKPHYLEYILNEENHLYFPDFYLHEYDVYLDPKNDYLIKEGQSRLGISDKEKIEIVSKQNDVRIIILDKNHLLYEQFKNLL